MKAAEYKKICQRPDVLSRFILEETTRLLPASSNLKAQLQILSTQEPIEKPELHNCNHRNADHFYINLTGQEVAEIADILSSLEAEAVTPDGESMPHEAFIAHFVDVWTNYREFKGN